MGKALFAPEVKSWLTYSQAEMCRNNILLCLCSGAKKEKKTDIAQQRGFHTVPKREFQSVLTEKNRWSSDAVKQIWY